MARSRSFARIVGRSPRFYETASSPGIHLVWGGVGQVRPLRDKRNGDAFTSESRMRGPLGPHAPQLPREVPHLPRGLGLPCASSACFTPINDQPL